MSSPPTTTNAVSRTSQMMLLRSATSVSPVLKKYW